MQDGGLNLSPRHDWQFVGLIEQVEQFTAHIVQSMFPVSIYPGEHVHAGAEIRLAPKQVVQLDAVPEQVMQTEEHVAQNLLYPLS
jgi:hypothetical protein